MERPASRLRLVEHFSSPFPLVANDFRSVLAVKGPLRRFVPWTAAGRSEEMAVYEGKWAFRAVWTLEPYSTRRCRSEAKEGAERVDATRCRGYPPGRPRNIV